MNQELNDTGNPRGMDELIRRPAFAAIGIAIATALFLLSFEAIKELVAPGFTKWGSHATTVVFSGLSSGLVAFAALGRFHAVNRALRRENEERKRAEREARKALDERQSLFRELQHRVKNSFMMISSLIRLTQTEARTEESTLLLSDIGDRVDAVSELYGMLHSTGSIQDVDLDSYLSRILGLLARDNRIGVSTELAAGRIPTRTAVPIGLIVTELMTNALKHAFPGGRRGTVTLRALREADGLSLRFSDDGVGLPAGVDPAATRSIGMTIVRSLVDQLDGKFEVIVAGGTAWSFRLPLPAPGGAAPRV
jgi:two-component sensor histidine kinase